MARIIVGIDPGVGGACVQLTEGEIIDWCLNDETPTDLAMWLRSAKESRTFAFIEKVHAMPGNGSIASFKLGQSYGFLKACLICYGIPFEEVSPRRWQAYLGIQPRKKSETHCKFKSRLKGEAQRIFPTQHFTLKNADAALIAEYGTRIIARS